MLLSIATGTVVALSNGETATVVIKGDTDGDGIGNVPQKYATKEGRKVVEDSKKVGDLLKNPNKYFFMILGIVLVEIAILVTIIFVITKVIQRVIRKRKRKDAN